MDFSNHQLERDQLEVLNNSLKGRKTSESQKQINIEETFSKLVSLLNKETPDISLIESTLEDIGIYYTNSEISHKFDFFFQNQDNSKILIHLVYNFNGGIQFHSLLTIFYLISINKDLIIKFIESDLYTLLISILRENDRFGECIYKTTLQILKTIFLYKDEQNIKLFRESSFSSALIDLLLNISKDKITAEDNYFVLDNFIAYNSNFIQFNEDQLNQKYCDKFSSQQRQEIFYRISIEESIIDLIGLMYDFDNNIENEITNIILESMKNLIENSNKIYLTSSISKCLSLMMNSYQYVQIQYFITGFSESLNRFLDFNDFQIIWPRILQTDIFALQSIYENTKDESNSDKEFLKQRALEIINPRLLLNTLTKIIQTSDQKENNYQQNCIAQILNAFTILFKLNPLIMTDINEEGQTQYLTIDEFMQILKICDGYSGTVYKFFEKSILFIFTAFNTQSYFDDRIEIIDLIFQQYNESIINFLGSIGIQKNTILEVLLKQFDTFSKDLDKGKNIQEFLLNQEFHELLDEWKDDENIDIRNNSQILSDRIDQFAS